MNIKITDQLIVELLIQNLAQQRATTKILFEVIAKDNHHAEDLNNLLNIELKAEIDVVIADVFSRHGSIDFDNLLGRNP